MTDREWFQVETEQGQALPCSGQGTEAPNRAMAVEAAERLARERSEKLTVVRYTRREVRTFQRRITVDEADLPITPPA